MSLLLRSSSREKKNHIQESWRLVEFGSRLTRYDGALLQRKLKLIELLWELLSLLPISFVSLGSQAFCLAGLFRARELPLMLKAALTAVARQPFHQTEHRLSRW